MASTQYKTNVELFGNCPFTNDYEHTLRALPIADKLSWLRTNCVQETDLVAHNQDFKNIMLFKLDSGTNKGVLRLRCVASHAYGFNYAYIDDTDKGNQWFCFITGCRYINDADVPGDGVKRGVYEFDLELDLIMTNLLSDDQLCDCIIKRMHTSTDGLFQHLSNEPIGDFNEIEIPLRRDYTVGNFKIALCVASKWFRERANADMMWCASMPQVNPILIFDYTKAGAYEMLQFVAHTGTDPTITISDIIAIYLLPIKGFTLTSGTGDTIYWQDNDGGEHTTPLISDFTTQDIDISFLFPTWSGRFPGESTFTPSNTKLYSGQFCKLRVEIGGADMIDLLPQNFIPYAYNEQTGTIDIKFKYDCAPNYPPTITLTPWNYKGDFYAQDYAIHAANFPQIATASDNYTQWANSGQQQASQMGRLLQGISGAVTATAGLATGNPAMIGSGASSLLGTASASFMEVYSKKTDNTSARAGAVDNASAIIMGTQYCIEWKWIVPDNYAARKIDAFLTRYGYALDNNFIKPSTYNRHRYTYLQTAEDCYSNSETQAWSSHVNGKANASQITQINNIFKKGITFWNNSVPRELICDYTINNPPLNI